MVWDAENRARRSRGADARNENRDLPFALIPNLLPGELEMGRGIVNVVKLIRPPGAFDFAGQTVGNTVITFWRVRRNSGRGNDHFGAVGA